MISKSTEFFWITLDFYSIFCRSISFSLFYWISSEFLAKCTGQDFWNEMNWFVIDSGFNWFYRLRLLHIPDFTDSGFFRFLILQIPGFKIPGFTDSWFYRFLAIKFGLLQIPGFTDSWFHRLLVLRFRVLQIPILPLRFPFSVPRSMFFRYPLVLPSCYNAGTFMVSKLTSTLK